MGSFGTSGVTNVEASPDTLDRSGPCLRFGGFELKNNYLLSHVSSRPATLINLFSAVVVFFFMLILITSSHIALKPNIYKECLFVRRTANVRLT